jgi:peptidoglycan/LPS O-acetylase OafA/YrhL
MIKVYAVALVLGVVALIGVVIRTTLTDKALDERWRLVLGAVLGFAMGGMAAEYSPLDISWPVALAIAAVAAAGAVVWVRYATRQEG